MEGVRTRLPSIADHERRLQGAPRELFVGSIACFTFAGTVRYENGFRDVTSVRVSQDMLEVWFDELGLDKSQLPPRIAPINAFRKASNQTVAVGDRVLKVREVEASAERIVRHIEVSGEPKHLASLMFIRGRDRASSTIKTTILNHVRGDDRVLVAQLITLIFDQYEQAGANHDAPAMRAVVRDYLARLDGFPLRAAGQATYFVAREHWATLDTMRVLFERIGQGASFVHVPLIDSEYDRAMLLESFEDEVEDRVRILLKRLVAERSTDYDGLVGWAQRTTALLGADSPRTIAALTEARRHLEGTHA